jgi:threonine/homoserine efflux transporter RhtA
MPFRLGVGALILAAILRPLIVPMNAEERLLRHHFGE